jgi:hypothetical protein
MPLLYQLFEDYKQNEDRLDIKKAISGLKIPILICHGNSDPAVPVEAAFQLKQWQPNARLFIVESDHVFGRKHPWAGDNLPAAMDEVINATLRFASNNE